MANYPAKELVNLIRTESDHGIGRLATFSVISGIATAALLAVINHAADIAASAVVELQYLAIYSVIATIALYSQKYALQRAVFMVEAILCKIRIRFADKIRQTELQFIETKGAEDIYNILARDTALISQGSTMIFSALQAVILLIFALIYLSLISFEGFLITVSAIALAAYVFILYRRSIIRDLEAASRKETEFFEALNHSLSGFKEVKLNRARSNDLFQHQKHIALEVEHHKARAGASSVIVMIFGMVFLYALIATILFVWPLLSPETSTDVVIKLTASILFILGPLEKLIGPLPLLLKTDVAIQSIRTLEQLVDANSRVSPQNLSTPVKERFFRTLEFDQVRFQYMDAEGQPSFSVGPIQFQVERNDILFIVGGNGSGKSTLMKLLTGLYYPSGGRILLNNELVDQALYPEYRELFSIIFTDFHLFDRLYGLGAVDEERMEKMLVTMDLQRKTAFREGRFTNLRLSTGQRKRLAFINATLEDKQIYIFDEWAADQDPAFRKYFYEVLLPGLRDQGKTVIAVTHDDRYFHTADRILKLEEGKLVEPVVWERA